MSGRTETSDKKSHKSFHTLEDPKCLHININKPKVVSQTVSVLTCPNANITKSNVAVSSPGVSTTECDWRCPSSLSTTVVDTSEKCEVVVHGQTNKKIGSIDSNEELVPRLHVVKCKNTTAFGLVSPKIIRKRIPGKDAGQSGKDDLPTILRVQIETQAQSPTGKTSQPRSLLPRPDHLPLDSSDLSTHALHFGAICLTGGRDKTGRAVVEVYGDQPGWTCSHVSSLELCHVLLYFHQIIRREIRKLGMTVVVDARKNLPLSKFYRCLLMLQKQTPNAVHSVLVLMDKESSHQPERGFGIQTDVVTSLKALYKIVEVNQLTTYLEGSFPHSHRDWIELHQKLHPFVSDLHQASGLLLEAFRKLNELQKMDTDVPQCIVDQKTLMRTVLDDSRLVGLQREGGAILTRLRKESDLRYPHFEVYSDAVDSVTSLYNHVEEQVHFLVKRSNLSLEHLEYLLLLKEIEGHFTHIQEWFDEEGETQLLEADSVEDSRDRLEQTLLKFTSFLIEANDRRHQAMSLVSEAEKLYGEGLSYPETEVFRTMLCTFKSALDNFLLRADTRCQELETMVTVCAFCERATELVRECKQYLEHTQTSSQTTQDKGQYISTLQSYEEKFLQFSAECFQEVKIQACALPDSSGMRVWNVAWLKCLEARQQLQERLHDVDDIHQKHYPGLWGPPRAPSSGRQQLSTPVMGHLQWDGAVSAMGEMNIRTHRPVLGSSSSSSNSTTTIACCNIKAGDNNKDTSRTSGSKIRPDAPPMTGKKATERESRTKETNRGMATRDTAALSPPHTVGCHWFPWQRGLGSRSVSKDSCATAVAAISSGAETRFRAQSNCSHYSQPSCRILQEAQKFQISRHRSFCSEESCNGEFAGSSSAKHSSLPVGRCEGTPRLGNPEERSRETLRLQRVMEELVFTEREYVRSLGYIMTHYHPLLQRPDITQDLRGKRAIVFGNLEKLFDFHLHYFLPELEACQKEPALVARCFLRHSEQFGLYALYSKNKPRSDALILHKRHDIFKRKQQELGDLMDLSSYLLRPIQRISKYSLLLQDMLRLCSSRRQQGRDTLAAGGRGVCGQDGFSQGPDQQRSLERSEIRAATELVRFQMRHGNDLLTMDAIQDCDVNLKEQGQLIRQDEFTVFFRKKKCVRRLFLFQDLILFSKTKKTDVGDDVYIYKQSFKTCDIGMTHNSSMSGQCFEIWFQRRKSKDTYTLKAARMEVKTAWTTDLEQILWEQAAHSRELRMQERVFMGMGRRTLMDIQPSEAAICNRTVNYVLPVVEVDIPELLDERTHVLSISEHTCFSATMGEVEDPLSFATHSFKSPATLNRAISLKRNNLSGVTMKKPIIASNPATSQSKDMVVIGKSTEV
ncbi:puratrophin-1-like [Aplochiton taeniatus]